MEVGTRPWVLFPPAEGEPPPPPATYTAYQQQQQLQQPPQPPQQQQSGASAQALQQYHAQVQQYNAVMLGLAQAPVSAELAAYYGVASTGAIEGVATPPPLAPPSTFNPPQW